MEDIHADFGDDNLNDSAHSEMAQDLPDAGLENLQREAETNLGLVPGPFVIDFNTNLRASQVEGINLEVELNPRNFRKALRSLTYDACMNSQECEEMQNTLIAGTSNKEQNIILRELEQTKAAGKRLGIDFKFTDEMIMKKMIENEQKEFTLRQRNSSSC